MFTATPTNGGTAPIYQWKVNGANAGTNSATYSRTPANNDHVSCMLTSNVACATGNPATSDTIKMTVFPILPVSLTITASANPSCTGDVVTFTAFPVNGGLGPLTQWYVNGSAMLGEWDPIFTYVPANGDSINCRMYAAVVCPSVYPVWSNAIIMAINTPPVLPLVGIHVPSTNQIIWNWNTVASATGYKWNTINDTASAINMGTLTTKTETGLTCNTPYTRYAWAYNACGKSLPVTLNQTTLINPSSPVAGTHTPSPTQIIWNWNTVPNATGYKWNTTNDYTTATDMGTAVTKTETGLTCNTAYTRYAWAYNTCGNSTPLSLSQTTSACSSSCGSSLVISHTAGSVAPVSKTVTYGTVTNIPGATSKCWIAKNLGATNQASAVNDATEAAAGWYWQFNKKQGYKHDGTTRTPATTWINSISENSNWLPANDPCTLELGIGWRLPTSTEWTNVDASGGWTNWTGPYASGLKLHAAGYLYGSDGSLYNRGSGGYYWSSPQYDASNGWYLVFYSGSSFMSTNFKAYGFTARCLRD